MCLNGFIEIGFAINFYGFNAFAARKAEWLGAKTNRWATLNTLLFVFLENENEIS